MFLMKFLAPLLCLFLATSATASSIASHITVVDPRVRLVPPGTKATEVFMTLRNSGGRPAHLVSAASGFARVVELHDFVQHAGAMRMQQIKEIIVPAGGQTELRPGSLHVMLIDMTSPLNEGAFVPITLNFSDGSRKEVQAIVRKHQAAPMRHMGH